MPHVLGIDQLRLTRLFLSSLSPYSWTRSLISSKDQIIFRECSRGCSSSHSESFSSSAFPNSSSLYSVLEPDSISKTIEISLTVV